MTNPFHTTQEHLDIQDIVNDMVILKDGSACLVIEVSAVNFGLFSEKEQEATIYAYAQLLNSLTFSIQIVVTSKRKDVSDYIKLLDAQLEKTTEPKIKDQLVKYRDFVRAIVRQGNVLDKKFYISIPFSSLEIGIGSSLKGLGSRPTQARLPTSAVVDRATTNLSPKRDHLMRLLSRIGLRARQLTTAELIQLFFDTYNPGQLGIKATLPAILSAGPDSLPNPS